MHLRFAELSFMFRDVDAPGSHLSADGHTNPLESLGAWAALERFRSIDPRRPGAATPRTL
jgi:hypothetical protein